MARPCIICTNGLSSYVRKMTQDGKMPAAIIRSVEKKFGIKLSYANIRHHVKYHDENAGTLVIATRSAQQKLAEATELKNNAMTMAENVQKFFVQSWELIDQVNWNDFQSMPLDKQMKVIKEFGGLMKDYKKIEMEQDKLDRDRDPALSNILKLMSRSKSLHTVDKQDGTES